MITLDACAMESYLRAEPAEVAVRQLLHSGEQVVMTSINAAQVVDRMVRVAGVDFDEVSADVAVLVSTSGIDANLAGSAAALRIRHYHRERCAVSLADCCAAAHALERDSTLVTSDAALLDLVSAEGGRVVAVADSLGRVHVPRRHQVAAPVTGAVW